MKNIVNKNKTKQFQTRFGFTDGPSTTDNLVMNSKFNDFFVNIGLNIAKKSLTKIYHHLILWVDHQLTQYFYPMLPRWKSTTVIAYEISYGISYEIPYETLFAELYE